MKDEFEYTPKDARRAKWDRRQKAEARKSLRQGKKKQPRPEEDDDGWN